MSVTVDVWMLAVGAAAFAASVFVNIYLTIISGHVHRELVSAMEFKKDDIQLLQRRLQYQETQLTQMWERITRYAQSVDKLDHDWLLYRYSPDTYRSIKRPEGKLAHLNDDEDETKEE